MGTNPQIRPIILASFSIGEIWVSWVNYSPGIWYVDFNGIYPLVDPELSDGFETKAIVEIGAVLSNGASLQEQTSLGLLDTNEGWYWDFSTKTLYVKLQDSTRPEAVGIKIGINIFVGSETFSSISEQKLYRPDLKSLPPLTQSKDRLFFKKIQTSTFQMRLDNGSLFYDGIKDWDIYNQRIEYLFGYSNQTLANFSLVKVGQIKDFEFSGTDVILNIIDPRFQFKARIPEKTYSKGTFFDLSDDDAGQPIQIAFGEIRNAAPIIVNIEGSEPFVCKLADETVASIKSIDTVRVDGAVVTPSNIDLTNCTFELSAAQVKDGTVFREVEVDFKGYVDDGNNLIDNPLDIILFILDRFLQIEFNTVNFNVSEWNLETNKASQIPAYLYVDTKRSIKSIIEEISYSLRGGFIPQNDGKYTFRTLDRTSIYDLIIDDFDWIETPDVSVDTDEILSYVRIGYDKNVNDKRFRVVEDRNSEIDVINAFAIRDDETFNTLLKLKSSAEDLGADIMSLSNTEAVIIKGKVSLDYAFVRAGKLFKADVNRFVDGEFQEWYGTLTGEILSVAPDIFNEYTELVLRVIPNVGREVGAIGVIYGLAPYGLPNYGGT